MTEPAMPTILPMLSSIEGVVVAVDVPVVVPCVFEPQFLLPMML
jgi:hypothetical protein